VFNAIGEVSQICIMARNITEQMKMEQSLQLSNERFRMATSVMNDVVWDWDVTTDQVLLGDNFRELFGYDVSNKTVSLSFWKEHIHPDDLESVIESVDKVLESPGNTKWTAEYQYICSDGSIAYVCDRGVVMHDQFGKPIRLIGAMQNITEITEYRKSLEKKVEERTHELNQALSKEKRLVEVKSRFVSMASHEFRTPLSTIQFAAGFVKQYYSTLQPGVIVSKLEGIEKQVQLLVGLLDDMLTIGKCEAARLKVDAVGIDLKGFFDKISEEIETSTRGTHRIVSSYRPDDKITVRSDEKFLRNIFINLLSNAIKFSPGKPAVFLDIQKEANMVNIKVRDEGIGVPTEDKNKLFEPFQRGNNVDSIQGTGLGLSIVKKAVETLGGQVSLDSTLGKGTAFTVKLPVQ
jgi:PAS domain S-box-containing protein